MILPAVMAFFACGPQHGKSSARYMPILVPQASSIQVLQKMEPGCEPVGQVTGRAAGPESGEVIWRYALNDLRNKAFEQRANVVFMEKYDHRMEKGMLHIAINGTLLQCGGPGSLEPGGADGNEPPPSGLEEGEDLVPPQVEDGDQLTPPAL